MLRLKNCLKQRNFTYNFFKLKFSINNIKFYSTKNYNEFPLDNIRPRSANSDSSDRSDMEENEEVLKDILPNKTNILIDEETEEATIEKEYETHNKSIYDTETESLNHFFMDRNFKCKILF